MKELSEWLKQASDRTIQLSWAGKSTILHDIFQCECIVQEYIVGCGQADTLEKAVEIALKDASPSSE